MSECVICGKDSGKGKTCGSTCRSKLARSVANATVKTVDATVGDQSVATPEGLIDKDKLPASYGQPDCQCRHCRAAKANKSKHALNHGPYKTAFASDKNEINRVSLPGDQDYAGVCGLIKT